MLAIPARRPLLLGGGAYQPPPGNVISNWRAAGYGGTSGLPDGWNMGSAPGVMFSVLSRTVFRGGNIIEFQFAGTATAPGNMFVQLGSGVSAVVAPGQVWRQRIFAEPVGNPLPGPMQLQGQWRNSAQGFLATMAGANAVGLIAGPEIAPADSVAPANAAYAGLFIIRTVSAGQTANLRYRIFAPTLWRVS